MPYIALPVNQVLSDFLKQTGLSQAQMAEKCSVSASTINLILRHDIWPKRQELTEKLEKSMKEIFIQHGAAPNEVNAAFEECASRRMNWTSPSSRLTRASAPTPSPQTNQSKDEDMLLRKHTITPDAREYFHLERDPFTNEMRGVADVFLNDNIKKVRAAVRNVAEHGGMLAVIAESGAGKSTIRKDLAHWIKNSDRPVVVIEPYVIGMEDDPTKGRPLKAEDVVTSVMRRLSPSTKIARSNQKRLEQMHDQLKISAAAGNHHILIIEEAHRLAVPTIRHMKTFYELDDGFTPLLGILLVGQTELGWKLGDGNFEVREVVQRLEKRYIEPMDLSDVTLYLRHKFDRIGANFDKVFAADAVEAMVQRLRVTTETRLRGHRTLGPRSLCYPLAINNLASGAINLAHQGGEELVTAALIAQVGREE